MARQYSRHQIDKTQFLTAGSLPEMQNAQANSRENTQELTGESLGGINRQLYEFVASALQMSLENIISSQSVEFQKLSQQIYSNIVGIVEGKMADGDIAESMLQNLDIYNQETQSNKTTPKTTDVSETPAETQSDTQTVTSTIQKDVDKHETETTIVQPQKIIKSSKDVINNTQIESNVEVHKTTVTDQSIVETSIDLSAAAEKYDEDMDNTISTANEYAEKINELRAKLRLALVYLRSQKVDIFKILASTEEDAKAIVENQEEIDLDAEEEIRKRRNIRKGFDKRLAKEFEWYKKAFEKLEEKTATKEGQEVSIKREPIVPNPADQMLKAVSKSRSNAIESPRKKLSKQGKIPEISLDKAKIKQEPTTIKKPSEAKASPRSQGKAQVIPTIVTKATSDRIAGPSRKQKAIQHKTGIPETIKKTKTIKPKKSLVSKRGLTKKDPIKQQTVKSVIPRKVKQSPSKSSSPRNPLKADTINFWKNATNFWKNLYYKTVSNQSSGERSPEAPEAEVPKKRSLLSRIFGLKPRKRLIVRTFIKRIDKLKEPFRSKIIKFIKSSSKDYFDEVEFEQKPTLIQKIKGTIINVKKAIRGKIQNVKKRIQEKKKAIKKKITNAKNKVLRVLTFGLLGRNKINWKKEATYWKLRARVWMAFSDMWFDIKEQWRRASEKWENIALTWRKIALTGNAPKAVRRLKSESDSSGEETQDQKQTTGEPGLLKRGWMQFKSDVKARAREVWTGVKKVGRKIWDKTKPIRNKIKNKVKAVAKKVWNSAKKIAAKVARVAYRVGKKVVRAVYRGVTKAIVKVTAGIGKGFRALGNAAIKIPYVGFILGPILMGIGTGFTATSRFLRAAFKTIGKIANSVVNAIEKAVKSLSKVISKSRSVLKKVNDSKPNLGSIKAFFTNFGRIIKAWTSKWFFSAYTKQVERAADSFNYKPKLPQFKWKAKFGDKNIRKRAEGIIRSIYDSSINMTVNATRSGFEWIRTITKTLSNSLSGILSSIGQRMAILGTVGFKGFLKSLFSWKVLLPLGILIFFLFRKKLIPWIKNKAKNFIKNIATIGKKVYGGMKSAFKWTMSVGGKILRWLGRNTDPNNKSGFGYWLTKGITFIGKIIFGMMKAFLKASSWLGVSPFTVGMAVAGFWGPAAGQAIYGGIKRLIQWWFNINVKLPIKMALSLLLPKSFMGIEIRDRVLGWLGLGPEPKDQEPRDLNKAVDELSERTITPINKIMASGKGAEIVNPKLKAAGLPGLTTLVGNVKKNIRANNSMIQAFSTFIKTASSHLLDINHVAQFTAKFYGSEEVTRALLSVFFFNDPITGHVISLIPKSSIPNVVKDIQKKVMDAKDNPKKLVQVNRNVLTYFDYMNVGRSVVIDKIQKQFGDRIEELSKATPQKAKQLAAQLATDAKEHNMVRDAMASFQTDIAAKISGKGTKDEITAKRKSVEGGNVFNHGVTDLLKAGGGLDNKEIKKRKKAGKDVIDKEDFNKNWVVQVPKGIKPGDISVGSMVTEKPSSSKPKDEQGNAWVEYKRKTRQMVAAGKTYQEIKAAGLGKSYTEWLATYEKDKGVPKVEPQPKQQTTKKVGDVKIPTVATQKTSATDVSEPHEESDIPPKTSLSTINVKLPTVAKGKTQTVSVSKAKLPQINLPKITLPQSKPVRIKLPGLTRDIKEGTEAHKLYNLGTVAPKKRGARGGAHLTKTEQGNQKDNAWVEYKKKTREMIAAGKTYQEIKAAGYGMRYGEWSKHYNAHKADKELESSETNDVKTNSKEGTKIVDVGIAPKKKPSMDGVTSSILLGIENKQKNIADDISKLDIGVALGKPKLPKAFTGVGKKKTTIAALGPIKLPEIESKPIKDDLSPGKSGIPKLDRLMVEAPKEKQLLPQVQLRNEDLERQGVSLMSDLQWVSAKEAHQMEQRLISNAKDIREIIHGLNIMGDNLENAKTDLSSRMEEEKENLQGQVINLPPTVIPSQVSFVVPDMKDYDPLPALF